MIQKIIADVDEFHSLVKQMESTAPYYPDILERKTETSLYIGTNVRIERNETWHKILHLQCLSLPHSLEDYKFAIDRLHHDCYLSRLFYVINDDSQFVDPLQISEEDRLKFHPYES